MFKLYIWLRNATGSICILFWLTNAIAADLLDIYKQALENDPSFKEAFNHFKANSESIPQALSTLLPQVDLSARRSKNVINVDVPGPDGLNGQETYSANAWTINASQAVFNYEAWYNVKQAKASVRAAHAAFNSAAQDLLLRTAKAYFDVLLAKDTLKFAEAKKRANERQLDEAQQRLNVGIDTITSVYEAKAAYDQSISQVIAAKNNQINQNENLSRITNHYYDYVAPLKNGAIPLIKPNPTDVEEWVATRIRQNYNIYAAKYNLQAARENIKSQAGSGYPTLSVQGNSTGNNNFSDAQSNFFVPGKQVLSSVAIALNYPVFKGGLVSANTKQAHYQFQAASEQLERVYRDVVVNSRIAFNTIIDGISKVKADRQTVVSQQISLESTEAQYQIETRTMADVVNVQQRLFEAQEQLASDQYHLINATLNLKYLAGSLNVTDIEQINTWLEPKRTSK